LPWVSALSLQEKKRPDGVAAPAWKSSCSATIIELACYVPKQRDDVKIKVRIWFFIDAPRVRADPAIETGP
jgi:hypothetical protein